MRRGVVMVLTVLLTACSGGGEAATTAPPGTTTTTVATTTTTTTVTPTTSVTTTTTTVPEPTPFPAGGLGPPCVPEACDVGAVAAWGYADYEFGGRRGVLGLLTVEQIEVEDGDGQMVSVDQGLMAGVLLGLEVTLVDEEDGGIHTEIGLSFYLGDHPVTGTPIVGEVGVVARPRDSWLATGFSAAALPDTTEDDQFAYVDYTTCHQIPQDECRGPQTMGSRFLTLGELVNHLVVGGAYTFWVALRRSPPPPEDAHYARYSQGLAHAQGLVSAMLGGEVEPGSGPTFATLNLQDPLAPAVPGVWMVVQPDCGLCDQMITAFRVAASDLPVYTMPITAPWPQSAGIEVVPTVWIVGPDGDQSGRYEGQEALAQASAIAAAACGLLGCVATDLGSGATTTTTRPLDWYESCAGVVAALTEDGYAAMSEVGALTRAAEDAQAGTAPWAVAADTARTWLIPALENLLASAETVLAADPDTVSQIAAAWFRDAATALLGQAEDLVDRVIDPDTGNVDEAVWASWWAAWFQTVQDFNDLLNRAPSMVNNCPD